MAMFETMVTYKIEVSMSPTRAAEALRDLFHSKTPEAITVVPDSAMAMILGHELAYGHYAAMTNPAWGEYLRKVCKKLKELHDITLSVSMESWYLISI